ncbi:MAG: hypothetical protein FJW23_04155 [Acidimicrobiia bacterium]|nr:hypothetical protein [Acidimicrobiia bacterium]
MPLPTDLDLSLPPFDQFSRVEPLGGDGRTIHARHQLLVGRDRHNPVSVLIKLTTKPGLVYQRDLQNEVATLTTVNRGLPDSTVFPRVYEHGQLPDGRTFMISTLFDEWPLATTIGPEPARGRTGLHLLTAIAVARALSELHALRIFHVDLNPMNILYRAGRPEPTIRIIDFESSYDVSRHGAGAFYDPPLTPGYAAPELPARAPDGRADVFSLGAVLYTLVAGHGWTWDRTADAAVAADTGLDEAGRAMLAKAVAPDPAGRYRTMAAFRQALDEYLERAWRGRSWS